MCHLKTQIDSALFKTVYDVKNLVLFIIGTPIIFLEKIVINRWDIFILFYIIIRSLIPYFVKLLIIFVLDQYWHFPRTQHRDNLYQHYFILHMLEYFHFRSIVIRITFDQIFIFLNCISLLMGIEVLFDFRSPFSVILRLVELKTTLRFTNQY